MSSNDADHFPDIPDFTLRRQIGSGGFGTVYLATNNTTGHLRAIKVIPLERTGRMDPAGREIQSLTRLETHVGHNQPNLIAIYHIGRTKDHLFYVMEPADDITGDVPVDGDAYRPATLDARLGQGAIPPDDCLHWARQLLTGLAALHSACMIHRDVKPSNCLFVNGALRLADFGLLTQAGPDVSRLGTETYMPPDGRMDARADVYAAGLVIYEMISGLPADRFPHLGARAGETVANPKLHTLMLLALRACEPDPEDRFSDAPAMLQVLNQWSAQSPARPGNTAMIRGYCLGGVACILAALFLTWFFTPTYVNVNFITQPHFDALVVLDGQVMKDDQEKPYRTPCTVDNLPAGTYHVLFRRDGLKDLDAGLIDVKANRQITAMWPDS